MFLVFVGADLCVRPEEGNHTGLPLRRTPPFLFQGGRIPVAVHVFAAVGRVVSELPVLRCDLEGRPLMEYSLALWIWTWSFPRNFTSRRTCSDSRCSSFATEGSLRISNSPWMLTAMLLSAILPTRLPFVS